MNILVIADEESKSLWDYYQPYKLENIDLILSCGDLNPSYLSFLATFAKGPVLYVHGNHDGRYQVKPPEGCICIEDMIYTYKGVRILGLGGSYRYSGGPHQYTEREMKKRVRRLFFQLRRNKGFDILLTHSAAYGVTDEDNFTHQGFQVFTDLLQKYKPKYHLHGHIHLNYGRKERRTVWNDIHVINGFETYRFEYESGKETKMALPEYYKITNITNE